MNKNTDTSAAQAAQPSIERIRHELRMRTLTVSEARYLTPNMIRICLTGPELAGFTSLSPDDHVKIFLPDGDGQELQKRDFTPRYYDPQSMTLTLDFVAHEGGPATRWAQQASVGQQLQLGGPRASQCLSGDIRRWLLIGDETALPAIGRRIEELPAGVSVTSLVAVPSAADEQRWQTRAALSAHWLHRDLHEAADAAPFLRQLGTLALEAGTFVWIAGEAAMVKAVRRYLINERGHDKAWLKAAGYWKQGVADSNEKSIDD
ncbi:siderophore-interacting protein [Granulosicoccaceae sp. 1_MG-2023]|nr:siderophore-interacting protein [Granulosicoccaceae sp. 1_MG-2023]